MKNAEEHYSDYPYAELSSDDGRSKLRIYTYAYEFPEIKTGSDADWQRNCLILTIPGFRAEIDEIIFEGSLLEHFLKQLKEFSAIQKKKVKLLPTEPYLELSFELSAMKKVIVRGYIQYPIPGPELRFDFITDLTYVNKFIEGIVAILKRFPPRY